MPILVAAANNPATTVTLTAVWLNVRSDPSDSVAFPVLDSMQPSTSQAGEVRPMASGGLRLVKQAGQPRSYNLSLELATRQQIDWLEAHIGVVLCVRDDRGRKFWAVYLAVAVDESVFSAEYGNVTLTLSEITATTPVSVGTAVP